MSDANEQQQKIIDHTEGPLVVDAGPGTGKTSTLVKRYIALLERDVKPNDILMVTFTNNAAAELRDRIRDAMSKAGRLDEINSIRTSTFDALCLRIVLGSPDIVSRFFDIDPILSRKARLVDNDSLNREYFMLFYSDFIREHGDRYRKDGNDVTALMGGLRTDLYKLINKMMARGMIPFRYDWFMDGESLVKGRTNNIGNVFANLDMKDVRKGVLKLADKDDYAVPAEILNALEKEEDRIPPEIYESLTNDDKRFLMLEFIRDVYFAYIERSVRDNRLTFGLTALFAFAVLYTDERTRKLHSVEHMMVDEFQDTNELQMEICLLLLNKPNLCAVGDWKQGIYGFRYVSPDNIINFEEKTRRLMRALNRDRQRIPFEVPEKFSKIPLEENYRSSGLVIEKSFKALDAKTTKEDKVTRIEDDPNIVMLRSSGDPLRNGHTGFDMIRGESLEDQQRAILDKIKDYVFSGNHKIVENGGLRDIRYGDIAVLCRNGRFCRSLKELADKEGVHAFLHGDVEIMSTREGKLVLAWLRYVNNAGDIKGKTAILADMGASLSYMDSVLGRNGGEGTMPRNLSDQRLTLLRKRRRPNDLITSIFEFYGLSNDITQAITTVLSRAYSGSLITISDLIRLIEDDINNETKYNVDALVNPDAITIQTAHSSKGLEFPIVIVAGLDNRSFPSQKTDSESLYFDEELGVRCMKEYFSRRDGDVLHERIIDSWRDRLIKDICKKHDRSEERRLLFVAMSRAKQYLCLAAGNDPSTFFNHFGEGNIFEGNGYDSRLTHEMRRSQIPQIAPYSKRRKNVSVHELMEAQDSAFAEGMDELSGKGADYGTAVHDAAYLISCGIEPNQEYPELEEIRRILDSLRGAEIRTEIRCALPAGDVTLRGIIDVMAEFDDRIEIHDYKTDENDLNLPLYKLQLSIYAHAAMGARGKRAVCFIDYVSQKKSIEFNPLPMTDIEAAVLNL
ncbi:MAG: UvrD-helicase domain-containing protein [Candidatus Methanomethylophilaceae archaeon]|nr:UvrD-helicase domain-containing protein [Candidatus Methanomethylophilaceae archaeon]